VFKNLSIVGRLFVAITVIGVLVLANLLVVALDMSSTLEEELSHRLETTTSAVADELDAVTAASYREVKGFARAAALQDATQWYRPGTAVEATFDALVRESDYVMILAVDPEGRVIGVNAHDSAGAPVDTRSLYSRRFAGEPWLSAVKAGQYTESMPFTHQEGAAGSGAYVEDVHVDDDAKRLAPEDGGLVVGFSTPVPGPDGRPIAYVKAYMRIIAVQRAFAHAYDELSGEGQAGASLVLLGSDGKVLYDYAPKGGDQGRALRYNEADKGNLAAKKAIAGETGVMEVDWAHSGREEAMAFAHLGGGRGFAGMNWAVMTAVPTDEAYAAVSSLQLRMLLALLGGLIVAQLIAVFIGRGISKDLRKLSAGAQRIAAGDIDQDLACTSTKESRELSASLTQIAETLGRFDVELESLVQQARVGELDQRCDAATYEGAYRRVMEGVNSILEAFSGPTRDLRDALSRAAEGDLTAKLDGTWGGEYALLQHAWNTTLGSLDAALTMARDAATRVDSRTAQIRDTAQMLAGGAAEQAATIEEISAQMTQMAGQTRTNAESSNKASEIARRASDGASKGDRAMNEMVEAMNAIQGSSRDISRIIKVIDEIAFQTNLLALNAAVEAARAGVHGKGFAVVAEEVRNLAARSAQAARETTEMIEASIEKVELGTRIARDTASALDQIVAGVGEVTDHIGRIAIASGEQAEGIAQITDGLNQVNHVIQNTTASSEESAAAALELSRDAEQLSERLMGFHLSSGGATAQLGGGGKGFGASAWGPSPAAPSRRAPAPMDDDLSAMLWDDEPAPAPAPTGFPAAFGGSAPIRTSDPRSRQLARPVPTPPPAAPEQDDFLDLSEQDTGSDGAWDPSSFMISLDDDDLGKF